MAEVKTFEERSQGEGSGTTSQQIQPARKQGVSCDACKFRKVKCDRRTKMENRREFESEDNIACSICTSHGLRCTFSQNAAKKNRRGRRIIAFQQGYSGSVIAQSLDAIYDAQQNAIPKPTEANPSSNINSDAPYPVITSRGLFDVEGLTKPLLDACLQGYFNYYAPCVSSLQTEVGTGG